MLSKAELEFVKGEKKVSPDYARMLKSRIRRKVKKARRELTVIERSGILVKPR